ncbi:MAG TPA: hypothetical protein VGY99_14635, partial [Candidatus Binataceae bacterium]|nr:hypothetical protein [Candidatus Binataceae bacterium]
MYASGNRRPALLGPIALAGAGSEFADRRLARQTGYPTSSDDGSTPLPISFSFPRLSCEARAGSIPAYIPVLIALSFAEYVHCTTSS